MLQAHRGAVTLEVLEVLCQGVLAPGHCAIAQFVVWLLASQLLTRWLK